MKFDGVSKNGDHNLEDSVEYTRIEYGYYLMAKAAGVIMNECRLLEDAGYAHFITKRFDRNNNKKIHMLVTISRHHSYPSEKKHGSKQEKM